MIGFVGALLLAVVGLGQPVLASVVAPVEECCSVAPSGVLDDAARGCLRSFSAETPVLMADGTTKEISDVKVGDEVLAGDPATGESGPGLVTLVWPHMDVLVEVGTTSGTIVAREDHRFWNASDGGWQQIQDFDSGDRFQVADGSIVRLVDLRWQTAARAGAHDITVEGLHSLYVLVDNYAVLAHNQDAFEPGTFVNEDGIRIQIFSNDHGPPHAHVIGGGETFRIGQNGHPLAGDPELSSAQRRVVERNRGMVRDQIRSYIRWFWNCG